MNLTYEIIGKGYVIKNNGVPWIVQESFIPYPGDTIEESVQLHIDELMKPDESVSEMEALQKQVTDQEQAIAELTMIVSMGMM